ncbi:MAG: hypothetical protein ACXVCX_02840 [Ktedonobacterales bacterium]
MSAARGAAGAECSAQVHVQGSAAGIPAPPRATLTRAYATWLYRERHLVEGGSNTLKHVRRICSRFDPVDRAYLGFIPFVCALIWLR